MGLLMMVSCTSEDTTASSSSGASAATAVTFKPYIGSGETRATYPESTPGNGIVGIIDNERLKTTAFGVFAQHTGNDDWQTYTKTVPFNFMWNQQVTWDTENSFWTYSPVKYWPNDNQPADDKGAQGSQPHSYLNFFAYAPYVNVANPGEGFDVKDVDENHDDKPDNDGIVAVSANSANVNASYIYYRTSNDSPFNPDESVDLLWATQQDLWKMKSSGEGYVNGQVNLPFRHALSKLEITVKTLIDRTANHTSDAYSTELDANSKVFIESATITTPDFYTEGKLMLTPYDATPTVPRWDYTGLEAKGGFKFYSTGDPGTTSYATDLVNYSMRYAGVNEPRNLGAITDIDGDGIDDVTGNRNPITDTNSDGIDDVTGLTEAETVKEVFDTMTDGVQTTELQLAANNRAFMFPPTPPSTGARAITVSIKYRVVTYDEGLTLNNPKYYSNVLNDITATLNESGFKFEANKHYKLVLNLGLTSVKFDVYVLDDGGEYILLSSVVKSWDLKTIEADVK